MSKTYGPQVLVQERGEHVYALLNGAAEVLDGLVGDLSLLGRSEDDTSLRPEEVGRLFLLARDAIRTGELLAQYGEEILGQVERVQYELEVVTPGDREGRQRRLQSWLDAAPHGREEPAVGWDAALPAAERRVA